MPTDLTTSEKSMRGRIAAHARWKKIPPSKRPAETAKARKAAMDRFEREVDPDGVLDPADRAVLAANARSEYFQRLALKSAEVRGSAGGEAA